VTPATAVGVDVGGTKIHGALVDREGGVIADCRVPTPHGGEQILDAVAEVAAELVTRPVGRPLGVGVGTPGLLDLAGTLRFAPNLPNVTGLDVLGGLRKRIGEIDADLAVVVENDANCAATAEHRLGAAKGSADALVVTLGTGIGGGIIAGGSLFRGANNFAGEIGHMVVDSNGLPCPCGKRGCWERYASGSGLGRTARDAANAGRALRIVELAGGDPDLVRGEHVVLAAAEGDEQAAAIFADVAHWLALGLANLTNLLDPQVIVLGGGLVEAGEVLLGPTRTAFADLVEAAEYRPAVAIVRACFGELAGAIGAAAIVLGDSH
jgi:glucokinase